MRTPWILASSLALALACGGTDASSLIADPAGPPGQAWSRQPGPAGVGTIELPTGGGWEVADGEATHADKDITVMLQGQAGIAPDQAADAVQLIVDANTRDAPKYAVASRTEGIVAGQPGARVDGSFDNGTAYVTRDYVFVGPGGMVAVMARAPTANAAEMGQVVDHIAASFEP